MKQPREKCRYGLHWSKTFFIYLELKIHTYISITNCTITWHYLHFDTVGCISLRISRKKHNICVRSICTKPATNKVNLKRVQPVPSCTLLIIQKPVLEKFRKLFIVIIQFSVQKKGNLKLNTKCKFSLCIYFSVTPTKISLTFVDPQPPTSRFRIRHLMRYSACHYNQCTVIVKEKRLQVQSYIANACHLIKCKKYVISQCLCQSNNN